MVSDEFKCYEGDNWDEAIEKIGEEVGEVKEGSLFGLGVTECIILLAWIAILISVVMPPLLHYTYQSTLQYFKELYEYILIGNFL